jgi:response regulator RpfG family c-di-GMP phosphodiesterase
MTDTIATATERLRILAVDDTAPLLRFLTSAFSSDGCEVAAASTAEQAIELLESQPFDLVVSDIKMPGLSGLDVLRTVKAKQPGTPVVLITGVPSVDSAVFGLRHGAYDYLAKPFTAKDLRSLVQRLRRDRDQGRIHSGIPAGLAEEQARRQFGVEVILKIGEMALEGLEPGQLLGQVVQYTAKSLGADAALVLLRDENGQFSATSDGDAELVRALPPRIIGSFEKLLETGGTQALVLGKRDDAVNVMVALMPGVDRAMGILSVARKAADGAFLAYEQELILGYAHNAALALQRMRLRENVESNLLNTIVSFVTAIESKDEYLKGHSARVSLYAGELATLMGLGPDDVLTTYRSGLLHDLGKLVIPDTILRKPGGLTAEEYELVKNHTVVGDKILSPLRFLAREAQAVRHHHERFDGKGYPDGIAGEAIPLLVRVVTVADAFDAMTSDRSYRRALPFEAALEQIERFAGTQFDPQLARLFLTIPSARLIEISGYQSARDASSESSDAAALAQGEAAVTR